MGRLQLQLRECFTIVIFAPLQGRKRRVLMAGSYLHWLLDPAASAFRSGQEEEHEEKGETARQRAIVVG